MHHDLVLVAGFSQRKSVLLLYGWCLLLNGLAIAMTQGSRPAIVVLGVGSAVATAYMARLLSHYRAAERDGSSAPDAANGLPPAAGPGAGPPA